MEGILRSREHDDRRSWSVYISGSTGAEDTVGIISILPNLESRDNGAARRELGYLFRPHAWGKGYATEACKAAIESLKADQVVPEGKVWAAVALENRSSLRVLAKLEFQFLADKVLGGPRRFLAGEWRPHEVLVFTKQV